MEDTALFVQQKNDYGAKVGVGNPKVGAIVGAELAQEDG